MEAAQIQVSLPEGEGMVRLTIADVQANLSEIVRQVAIDDKRIILLQDGKEIAAIVSIEAFKFLERMVERIEDEIDMRDAEIILAQSKAEDYITLEQLRQEVGLE